MRMKLGELLVRAHLVTPRQVKEGLDRQEAHGGRLGSALVALGYLKDDQIVDLLSRRFGLPKIKLEDFAVEPVVATILPAETAWKHRVLPISRSGTTLTLAMADPTNVAAVEEVHRLTGFKVEAVVVAEGALEEALIRHHGPLQVSPAASPRIAWPPDPPGLTMEDMASVGLSEVDLDSMAELEAAPDEAENEGSGIGGADDAAPIVKLTSVLLVDALKRRASHIHVEPRARDVLVRFRIDGVLHEVIVLPARLRETLTSRLKTMAHLDVTERRLPQRGIIRIRMTVEGRSRAQDYRISTLPTTRGEKVVLQLLGIRSLRLDRLGFDAEAEGRFRWALCSGLTVIAGPFGSGKSATLVAALANLNKPDVNITTIEAPVTRTLFGVQQVALRPADGYGPGAALRSCLGQGVDIVGIDPLGDDEVIETVVRLGAGSGLQFLATLVEMDAASAITTLLERGGRPIDLAGALQGVVAQRLVRCICPACKEDVTANTPLPLLVEAGFAPESAGTFPVFAGKGCGACQGTGYRGRTGVFEVLKVSEGIRDLIRVQAVAGEIRRKAVEEGMITLRMAGLERVKQGTTTVAEIARRTAD